jgi:hypothetical protein
MPTLFGKQYSRQELERHIGHLSQVAGVRLMELRDGLETGVRIADVRSGSGLRFQVSLDRGMDISVAEFKGAALAWRSANGDVHPSHYDPRGGEWLRSFPGGLVTGCGLTHLGAPCTDNGEELGLHGRLSNTPASEVESKTEWNDEQCTFRVSGAVRESGLFKDNLVLHRTVGVELGESIITLNDTVTNEGFSKAPFMLLYHINLGWPLIDEGGELLLNARSMTPRDAEATKGEATATKLPAPAQGYKEQVFIHELVSDSKGFATALVVNEKLQLGLFVQYRQKELPRFIQWKMVGEGTYVLGLEPANCSVQGRAKERERGTLQFLDPGEKREMFLRIGILEGSKALNQFKSENSLK